MLYISRKGASRIAVTCFLGSFIGPRAVFADPPAIFRQAELAVSDGATGDELGNSVAVSGDGTTAIVGAFNKNGTQGAAYVFTRCGNAWSQEFKLVASDGVANDQFASSVALSRDGATALVGANRKNGTGVAYIFARVGDAWAQEAVLAAPNGAALESFGSSVALSGNGNTALVGAFRRNNLTGSALVFTRTGSVWTLQKELTGNDSAQLDLLGFSVALSQDGTTALLGAFGKDTSRGAAYVFVLSSSGWIQQAKLNVASGSPFDFFGYSVSLSADGNSALVGAYGTNSNQGTAYMFTRVDGAWSQSDLLTASDGAAFDLFGLGVSLSADGHTALLSAWGKNFDLGAIYLFTRGAAGWNQQELTASGGTVNDRFGISIALSGDTTVLLAGAESKNFFTGDAYVFSMAGAASSTVNVTVCSSPPGLTVKVAGVDIITPITSQMNPGTSLTLGAASQQLGVPGTRYLFANWSNGGTQNQTVIVPPTDITYTAVYVQQNLLRLFATPAGEGSATAAPATPDSYYNATDSVSITATPSASFMLTGFSGDVTGTVSPVTLSMLLPRSVTANFARLADPTLGVVVNNDVSRAAQPGPSVTATITMHNSGGTASAVTIAALSARVLSPAGQTATVTSTLPIVIGAIPAGGDSRPISLQLSIPSAAVRTLVQGTITYTSGTLSFSFTVARAALAVPTPFVSSVSPVSSVRGRTVSISGSNFDTNCSNDSITVGGVSVHANAPCSNTALNFQLPFSAASGPTTVQVTTAAGSSGGLPFTVRKTRVIVAATPTPLNGYGGATDRFAVIDFSEPATPGIKVMSPLFASGASVVDCSGSHLVVGDALGGLVAIYDITNPATPTKLANLNTGFGSIGAIKFDGNRVLVGDYFGNTVTLIDVSSPASPQILSTIHQIFGIGSVGMSGSKAVAAGNNATIAIIDFTNATQPSWTTFLPRAGSSLTVDLDGSLAVAGASDTHQVSLVDIAGRAVVSQANPGICRFDAPFCEVSPDKCQLASCVTSVSIKGNKVAASSDTHRDVALIDFTSFSSPVVTNFDPQLGVAAPVIVFDGDFLAAGAINAAGAISYVNLFQINGITPTLLGSLNSTLPSIGTIGMCSF